jgi:hypothetical protein
MTLTQASEIVQAYGNALQKPTPAPAGPAKFESFLPCPHVKIKQAALLRLAEAYESGCLSQPMLESFRTALMFLHHFVPDEKARRINAKSDREERSAFMDQLTNYAVLDEIHSFMQSLNRLNCNDPSFWRKVFTLVKVHTGAGLEYEPSPGGATPSVLQKEPARPTGCLGIATALCFLVAVGYIVCV